jgi:Sulfate permease family
MDHVPGDFFHRMKAFAQAWNTISIPATTLSIASIAVMIFCLKYAKRIPGAIVVTFGATATVLLLRLPVETIGTRFGGIPSGLPTIAVPKLQYDVVRQLLSPAFTVAVLGANATSERKTSAPASTMRCSARQYFVRNSTLARAKIRQRWGIIRCHGTILSERNRETQLHYVCPKESSLLGKP